MLSDDVWPSTYIYMRRGHVVAPVVFGARTYRQTSLHFEDKKSYALVRVGHEVALLAALAAALLARKYAVAAAVAHRPAATLVHAAHARARTLDVRLRALTYTTAKVRARNVSAWVACYARTVRLVAPAVDVGESYLFFF